jgi:gliding motility-associated-like protein
VAFDQNGCAGLPDTTNAIIYKLSAANIQTYGNSPICLGQSSLIGAQTSGDTGPLSVNWNQGLGSGKGPFIVSPNQPTLYLVTVTNACGASISDSVRVAFNPPPTILASNVGTLSCLPDFVNFFDNSITGNANDPIKSWFWNFGDGATSTEQNPQHNYTSPGTYSVSVTVTTDGGCTSNNSSSPIVIIGYPYPVAAFTANPTTLNLPYDILSCTNLSTGAISYDWNFGDGGTSSLLNPKHTYLSVGEYQVQLIATSINSCKDTTYVTIIADADVVFPNAFTPNSGSASGGYYIPGNTDNDIFFPYATGVIEYKFQVFNRWGELIFETEDIKQGWDGYYRGNLCQVDVYVWKAYVKLNNGKIFNKTGDVTLLK